MRFIKSILLLTLLVLALGGFGDRAGVAGVSAETSRVDQRLVILETFMRPG